MDVIFELETLNDAVQQFMHITQKHKVFAFHGEMGVGKTTFIQAVCHAKGVTGTMGSPTFSIINEYKTLQGEIIFHIDLYRLQNGQEAVNAGVEDCLYSGNTCFVEWPERAAGIFPGDTLHCYLHMEENNRRKLKINL
ncbi:MAG TPA: tRNA (adenosine(37)-N6)-threonylcarbamoyltransferase complex ATPase subunit type 1 TsaE [Ferruginibacter sp.]|nr:tRNA (adenosine(37)-N6)-threonylcarbamoyltransferase complex ATPase subunit type 1 TsaE [Ferruginibacter sp.]